MKKHLTASLLIAASLLAYSTPSMAFRGSRMTGNPAAGDGTVVQTQEGLTQAVNLLKVMNKDGNFARDLYRNTFMQIMGLIFFDPNTPDIRACEKEVLNYHLPEVTRANLDFSLIINDMAKIMSEVYTEDELKWLQQFYSSPFGERMLKKQLVFNERMVRDFGYKYGKLQPEFQKVYATTAERCGGKVPSTASDAPALGTGISGSDLLSVPGRGAVPVAPSPEPVRQ